MYQGHFMITFNTLQHWCYYSENVCILREAVASLRSEMNKNVNISFMLEAVAQLDSCKASRQV